MIWMNKMLRSLCDTHNGFIVLCHGKNLPKMAAAKQGEHIAYVTSRMTPSEAKAQRDSFEKVEL